MSGYGIVERMKPAFARSLRPLKGGATGVAEIRRAVKVLGTRTWPEADEFVNVHYEQLRTEGGSGMDIDPSGQPGYTVYFDGVLDPPLADGDRLLVNGLTLTVIRVNEVGNNTPISSVTCEVVNP